MVSDACKLCPIQQLHLGITNMLLDVTRAPTDCGQDLLQTSQPALLTLCMISIGPI